MHECLTVARDARQALSSRSLPGMTIERFKGDASFPRLTEDFCLRLVCGALVAAGRT